MSPRLSLLHLLHLLRVFLLQLLRLLLVLLLHLLLFFLEWPAVSPAADVACPASAGVSADPGSASRSDFPVASGISGPASGFPCQVKRGVRRAAAPWDGMQRCGLSGRYDGSAPEVPGAAVAATGGAPWFAENRCWGLLRAASAC